MPISALCLIIRKHISWLSETQRCQGKERNKVFESIRRGKREFRLEFEEGDRDKRDFAVFSVHLQHNVLRKLEV